VNPSAVAAALEALARALAEPGAQPDPAHDGHGDHHVHLVHLPWNVLIQRPDLAPDDTLLDVAQAAEAIGVPRSGVYRRTSKWRREHDEHVTPLPHVRIEGALRFKLGELRRWLQDRERVVVAERARPVVVARRPRGAA
jgi:hypothetical protein